jgi:hypothetical protein
LDVEQLHLNVQAFAKVAHGEKSGGPMGQFDIPSRFRWLTALRSSAIQTSRPHPGYAMIWNKPRNACLKKWYCK